MNTLLKNYQNKFRLFLAVFLFIIVFLYAKSAQAVLGIDESIKQVKYSNSPVVYYLNHVQKIKKAYVNEAAFLSYGNKWSDVKTIMPSYLDKWTETRVVKTKNDYDIFEIKNGEKRKIKSEEELFKLGHKWSQIMEVSDFDLEQYIEIDINEVVDIDVRIAKSSAADNNKTLINVSNAKNVKKIANPIVVSKTVSPIITVLNKVSPININEGNGTKIILYWPIKGHVNYKFHDSNYLYDYEHQGIDIAANQGTRVRAAQSGNVIVAVNGGLTGYSYVIVDHGNGFKTVYGHLSRIDVTVGRYVTTSTGIGLSGGRPGTSGAGQYSNGPHLHFELIKDDKYIDPELYL